MVVIGTFIQGPGGLVLARQTWDHNRVVFEAAMIRISSGLRAPEKFSEPLSQGMGS
jgi:hypothetical protein